MFRSGKQQPPRKRIDGLIGTGTVVRGDIVFAGGLRIDGHVHGSVQATDGAPGTLVVGERGRVDGGITVSHVIVNGTVNGPVVADAFLELQAKARIVGDVTYRSIEMQVGAIVDGRMRHQEPGVASVVELRRATPE